MVAMTSLIFNCRLKLVCNFSMSLIMFTGTLYLDKSFNRRLWYSTVSKSLTNRSRNTIQKLWLNSRHSCRVLLRSRFAPEHLVCVVDPNWKLYLTLVSSVWSLFIIIMLITFDDVSNRLIPCHLWREVRYPFLGEKQIATVPLRYVPFVNKNICVEC